MSTTLSKVITSRGALISNIRLIRGVIGKKVLMAPAVKSNAYGHGLVETATSFLEGGADWLCVNALFEAQKLRKQLPKKYAKVPILILGYTPLSDLKEAVKLGCRLTVYNKETIAALKKTKGAIIHIKLETGNHRQGIHVDELVNFINQCKKNKITVEGISTHFANIEDIAVSSAFDGNSYPRQQLKRFEEAIDLLKKNNIEIPLAHCANSAATLLFPETHFQLVRPGVAAYGMWPSTEVESVFRQKHPGKNLRPALSWKTHVVQIKEIPAGAFVGYGCTFQAKRLTRLAILPVGYYDGYDRGLSNKAQVLIHKKRAPVVGRVCMNIMMVDVTDIPRVKLEDPVTLLGDGITAEELAMWAETINYEITTRIHEGIPRLLTN